jgi:hypothetical protein
MEGVSLALALAVLAGSPVCERADLLAAAGAGKVNERALLDAACGKECVLECKDAAPAEEGESAEVQYLHSHYEGSFRCPGKRESIVSYFPCGVGAGMHPMYGTVVLMQAARPARGGRGTRWEQADTVENTVLSGDCKVARAFGRDVLLCVSFWGPLQGITGQSPCVLRWSDGEFRMECATGLEDSCGSEAEGARSVTVESWTVGAAGPDGTVPMRLNVEVSDCDGKNASKLEGEVLVETGGIRLSPATAERFRKAGILGE